MAISHSNFLLSSNFVRSPPLKFAISTSINTSHNHNPNPNRFDKKAVKKIMSSSSDSAYMAGCGETLPEYYGDWVPNRDPKDRRRAGIILHPTSLPGPHGIGDLGESAFRFLDWLHQTGCTVWQTRGWWDSLKQEEKSHVQEYLSLTDGDDISWKMIQVAVASVAQTAIVPIQDVLGLGSSARMNIPATQFGNWNWRIPKSMDFDGMKLEAKKLRKLLLIYGRM